VDLLGFQEGLHFILFNSICNHAIKRILLESVSIPLCIGYPTELLVVSKLSPFLRYKIILLITNLKP